MSACGVFFISLLIFPADFPQTCVGGASAQEAPPAPTLVQLSSDVSLGVSSGVSSGVVLRCQAPAGHGGRVFQLYRVRTLALSQQFDTERSHADFLLNPDAADAQDIYCCLYDHSMYSAYTRPLPPTRPTTPPAPPLLSVTPPDGRVRLGQVVEFRCQAPPTLAPVAFVLQKQSWEKEDLQVVSRSTNPQMRVGPMDVANRGIYTCFYQMSQPEGIQNSAPSAPVSVIIEVDLPAPQLSQGAEGSLVCTGSPFYPAAHFSLFLQGSALPLETQPAPLSQHSVRFAVSGQHEEGGGYQCQYTVLLGDNWAHSELSAPVYLPCVTGSASCSPSSTNNYPPHTGSTDLPLVIGSASAALLFLMVLVFMVFGICKYVKSAAKKRRQREQDQFWKQVHSRDHVVDLTLQRVNTGSKEDGRAAASEPIYDSPLSTFTHPPTYWPSVSD